MRKALALLTCPAVEAGPQPREHLAAARQAGVNRLGLIDRRHCKGGLLRLEWSCNATLPIRAAGQADLDLMSDNFTHIISIVNRVRHRTS